MERPLSITEWYASRFELFEKGLNGESQTPLHAVRRKALARFASLGFPTTSDEEWRFTSVEPVVKTDFIPVVSYDAEGVTARDIERWTFGGPDAACLVFVDGHYSRELSSVPDLPPGVQIGSLAAALASDPGLVGRDLAREETYDRNAFTALNTAFLVDGAFVQVGNGVALEAPVHILCVSSARTTPFLSHPRTLILAGKGSRLSVVETFACSAQNRYLTNAVTEIRVGEGAIIEHDKVQTESSHACHIGTTHVLLGADSAFTSNAVMLGGALVHNNVTALFGGEHAECTLNGLALATGTQHVDNHTVIDHAAPHCASHELYKSILDGSARGVFNGKIFVRPGAQKTDAKQTNKTLLLSDNATIDTKPQLEIFADDVKCTHGATVGQLDEEQVFYLRTRGIGEAEARDLLTFAFATDVINRVHCGSLRGRLDALLRLRLQQGRVAGES